MADVLFAAWLIARKDLSIEFRTRSAFFSAVVFALLGLVIFYYAWDPTAVTATDLAPGVLWVIFTFSGLLGLHRSFGVEAEEHVMSAHRTPALVDEYVTSAEGRGLEVIIAGAGGAAHLAGVCAARTLLPVLGVPMQSKALNGMDSLLSTVQMPAGIPVGTLAIGQAGATNAGLLAGAILAGKHPPIRAALRKYRDSQTQALLAQTDPRA